MALRLSKIKSCELCPVISGYNAAVSTTADYEPRTKEPRACRNVTTKTVSTEPLAVEVPSAGGWAGYSQQIGYAIAPAQLVMTSDRPQAAHDNNQPCLATLYLMR